MTDLATRPTTITRPLETAGKRRARITRRRQVIAAAIAGEQYAAEVMAELALVDPVVEEAIAFDMTCAVTDRVSW